jgi:HEAT repeat protein
MLARGLMRTFPRCCALAVIAVASLTAHVRAAGPTADAMTVSDAVRALRRVDDVATTPAEKRAVNDALDAAFRTLEAHPEEAAAELARELVEIEALPGTHDYLRTEVAAALWSVKKADAAELVARAIAPVDPAKTFRSLFWIASSAAATRDPRVIPILAKMLDTDAESGSAFFAAHVLTVPWPWTLDFMIAPFGPQLCSFLPIQATLPANRKVLRSTIHLLDRSWCQGGAEWLRRVVHETDGDARGEALVALARRGAPEDTPLLVAESEHADAARRWTATFALYEHGSPRNGATLRRLLRDTDEEVRAEAIAALFHTIDLDGAKALIERSRAKDFGAAERAKFDRLIKSFAVEARSTEARLREGNTAEWKAAISRYSENRRRFFELGALEKCPSQDELAKAIAHWDELGRLGVAENDWTYRIESQHVLCAARPEDVAGLVRVRGSILRRQSDEAMNEVHIVDRILEVLGRRDAGAERPNE